MTRPETREERTYANVCCRMLTYADVSAAAAHDSWEDARRRHESPEQSPGGRHGMRPHAPYRSLSDAAAPVSPDMLASRRQVASSLALLVQKYKH